MATIYKWMNPITVDQARYDVLITRAGYFATPTPDPGDGTQQTNDVTYVDVANANTTLVNTLNWSVGDQVCVPMASSQSAANLTPTSGVAYLTGGPGMVVPAGVEVQGISFVSNAAAVTPTHQFAFVAVPDDTGLNQAVLVAVSGDLLTQAWGVNTAKKFSFRAVDGGSGFWKPTADTPVYGGICQVAGTPATLRGYTSSAFLGTIMQPKWFASAIGGGKVFPKDLHTVMSLNDAATYPFCRLSRTYN